MRSRGRETGGGGGCNKSSENKVREEVGNFNYLKNINLSGCREITAAPLISSKRFASREEIYYETDGANII